MVKTLEMAKKAWADKMKLSGPRWKAGVTGKADEWKQSVADFLKVDVGRIDPTRVKAYSVGVDRVTAEDFARAVEGKEEEYGRKLVDALTV